MYYLDTETTDDLIQEIADELDREILMSLRNMAMEHRMNSTSIEDDKVDWMKEGF